MKLQKLFAVVIAALVLLTPVVVSAAPVFPPAPPSVPEIPDFPGPPGSEVPSPGLPAWFVPVWFAAMQDNLAMRDALLDAMAAAEASFCYIDIVPSNLQNWDTWPDGPSFPDGVPCDLICRAFLADLLHYARYEVLLSEYLENIDFTLYITPNLTEQEVNDVFAAWYNELNESTRQMGLLIDLLIANTLVDCGCPTLGGGDNNGGGDCDCDCVTCECTCPTVPGTPGTPNVPGTPGATTPGGTNNLPQTGAAVVNAGIAGVGVAAVGAVAAFIKNKKQ